MATDVASKGLDFPAIQHVINYDMPEEIENYGTECGKLVGWTRGGPGLRGVNQRLFLSLQCTELAALGVQETRALPPPSSTRPAVRCSP